jgi:hypothetical protein
MRWRFRRFHLRCEHVFWEIESWVRLVLLLPQTMAEQASGGA